MTVAKSELWRRDITLNEIILVSLIFPVLWPCSLAMARLKSMPSRQQLSPRLHYYITLHRPTLLTDSWFHLAEEQILWRFVFVHHEFVVRWLTSNMDILTVLIVQGFFVAHTNHTSCMKLKRLDVVLFLLLDHLERLETEVKTSKRRLLICWENKVLAPVQRKLKIKHLEPLCEFHIISWHNDKTKPILDVP